MADWKRTSISSKDVNFGSLGNGLAIAFGKLVAKVTSGIEFDGAGNIVVKNGSGIAIDGSGRVTVNEGAGLTIDGSGFLTVDAGTGLSTAGGSGAVYIPGGAITNSLLAALAVGTSNIQAGAVGTTQIANAAITTAKIGTAQITTALIANASITNALLGTAVVGTANIQNAAITTALIANLAVGNAQISDLAASKITAGTISASISMTAPNITSTLGTKSIQLNAGDLISTDTATSSIVTLSGGNLQVQAGTAVALMNSAGIGVGVSGFSSNSVVITYNSLTFLVATATQLSMTNGILNLTGMAIKINGTTAIDSSRNGSFVDVNSTGAIKINGTTAIDSSRNGSFVDVNSTGAIKINGTTAIDSSRNGSFVNLSFSGNGPYSASAVLGSWSNAEGISISGSVIKNTGVINTPGTGTGGGIVVHYIASGSSPSVPATYSSWIYVWDQNANYIGKIPVF